MTKHLQHIGDGNIDEQQIIANSTRTNNNSLLTMA